MEGGATAGADQGRGAGGGARARLPAALAALLALAHAALALDAASRLSATYDEPYYATAGYARLTAGATALNPEHPPAGKLLLGAAWLGADLPDARGVRGFAAGDQWVFGPHLLFGQPERAEALLLRARAAVAILSGLVVLLVFAAGRRWFGAWAGLLGAALYALDPLVVANASLATLDLPVTAALFAAVLLSARALAAPRPARLLAAGAAAGLALATKGTGLAVLPALAPLWAAPWLGPAPADRDGWRLRTLALAALLAVAALAAALACLPEGPGAILRALALQRGHAAGGHLSWLLGERQLHCSPAFFPLAALIKAPLPTLAATALGLGLAAWSARRAPERAVALLLPPAILLGAAVAGGICNGLRQLLPAAPFLAVAAGGGLAWLVERLPARRAGALLAGAAVAWVAAGTLRVHPHELTWSNELAGGPTRTWERLSDANVDWGQALPALAEELRRRPVRRLWLDYFGTAFPPAHGAARYRRVRDARFLASYALAEPRLDGPEPGGQELLAVSATSLVDLYAASGDLHAWLRARTPVAFPGNAIFLYDLTGDAPGHRALATMAARAGDQLTAAEASARAEALERGAR